MCTLIKSATLTRTMSSSTMFQHRKFQRFVLSYWPHLSCQHILVIEYKYILLGSSLIITIICLAPEEQTPAMAPFSTRHTSSCHFSHMDTSGISFLGYLPQDIIGYSVFDFYHNDDLSLLKDIYEMGESVKNLEHLEAYFDTPNLVL